jgi:hypothetical protein
VPLRLSLPVRHTGSGTQAGIQPGLRAVARHFAGLAQLARRSWLPSPADLAGLGYTSWPPGAGGWGRWRLRGKCRLTSQRRSGAVLDFAPISHRDAWDGIALLLTADAFDMPP